jgi:hypothetical protein
MRDHPWLSFVVALRQQKDPFSVPGDSGLLGVSSPAAISDDGAVGAVGDVGVPNTNVLSVQVPNIHSRRI